MTEPITCDKCKSQISLVRIGENSAKMVCGCDPMTPGHSPINDPATLLALVMENEAFFREPFIKKPSLVERLFAVFKT